MEIIKIIEMPGWMEGRTVLDANDNYLIYINANLSDDAKERALEHERRHILAGDFFEQADIEEMERAARNACERKMGR